MDTNVEVMKALGSLVGLKLAAARNAGNMKVLHFGDLKRTEKGLVGKRALHVQCPWRIEQGNRIVTGSADYYTRADNNEDDEWEAGMAKGHLQNQILAELLQGHDLKTNSYINETDHFFVTDVSSDLLGGIKIRLSGDYQLVLFPCSSRSEEWRLLEPGSDQAHFVFESSPNKTE